MPGSTGSHDTGGVTTTGGVCWTDPADMAGQVNSLMERVTKLEQILSLLCGMDITAAQLSDITSSAGTLTDMMAILSNINGGWVSEGTFTGTAISTLGWPFFNSCTGEMESWPVVTMQDGVMQFGLSETGQACGEQVEYWNGGGAAAAAATVDYAVTKRTVSVVPADNRFYESSRGITITASAASGIETAASFTVSQAGIYWVHAYSLPATISGSGNATLALTFTDPTQRVGNTHNTTNAPFWEVNTLANLSAGNTITAALDLSSPLTGTMGQFELSAYRIGDAA